MCRRISPSELLEDEIINEKNIIISSIKILRQRVMYTEPILSPQLITDAVFEDETNQPFFEPIVPNMSNFEGA